MWVGMEGVVGVDTGMIGRMNYRDGHPKLARTEIAVRMVVSLHNLREGQ